MLSGETAQRQVKLYYFGSVIYSVALESKSFSVGVKMECCMKRSKNSVEANDKFLILVFFSLQTLPGTERQSRCSVESECLISSPAQY